MKPKTMILMGLAITCGLGASYMTSQLLAQRGDQAPEVEKIEILIAKRNLSVGDQIKKPEDMFEKKLVAVDGTEPKEAIRDPEALKNKIMKQNLRKGDHITLNELYGDGDSLPIPEGFKALGLRVNLETTASGFATLPHSRVDIIHTVRGNDHRSSYSQVLLQDVLVLAADTRIDRESGIAAPASVVTFALKDEDILTVNAAKEMGTLSLTLRKPNDRTHPNVRKKTFEMIGGKTGNDEPKVEAAPVKVAPPPQPKAVVQEKVEPKETEPSGTLHNLTIIQGTQQSTTRFRTTPDGQTIEEGTQSSGAGAPRPQPAAPKAKTKGIPSDL